MSRKPWPGTYLEYAPLAGLQPLVVAYVHLQRALAHVAKDDAARKSKGQEIDAALLLAHLKKGEFVTCGVYDVKHNERDGQTWLNGATVLELSVAGGVDRDFMRGILAQAEETGEVSKFATVAVTKGAKVRAA